MLPEMARENSQSDAALPCEGSAPQYGLALKTKFIVFESLPVMVTY
jgi:hypothetical protein